MAVPAFSLSGFTTPVETLFAAYIGIYFFMAITTQTRLTFLPEWLVTLTAVFFIFLMGLYKLTWHNQ